MQMTEQQQSEVKRLVHDCQRELVQGYDYTVLPDTEFTQEALPQDVIANLKDALAALERQPGRQ
jgi:hypothetical protein